MEKKEYTPVEIEIIKFNTADIIVTSGGDGDETEFMPNPITKQ